METRVDCRGNPGVKKQQMALLLKKRECEGLGTRPPDRSDITSGLGLPREPHGHIVDSQ